MLSFGQKTNDLNTAGRNFASCLRALQQANYGCHVNVAHRQNNVQWRCFCTIKRLDTEPMLQVILHVTQSYK